MSSEPQKPEEAMEEDKKDALSKVIEESLKEGEERSIPSKVMTLFGRLSPEELSEYLVHFVRARYDVGGYLSTLEKPKKDKCLVSLNRRRINIATLLEQELNRKGFDAREEGFLPGSNGKKEYMLYNIGSKILFFKKTDGGYSFETIR